MRRSSYSVSSWLLRRRSARRRSVLNGLAALVILPGIVGCTHQPTADYAATGILISAAPAISWIAPQPAATYWPASTAASLSPQTGAPTVTDYSAGPAMASAVGDVSGPSATALAALALLPVRDAAPQMGYRRDLFGQAWSDDVTVDEGHNGCDTRNDILRRDLTAVQIKVGTNGCVVRSGTLADPYSAEAIEFVRGAATSDSVQIDHLVALADAWRSGAQELTADQRQNFANDPLNLLAVSGPLNQAKGDGDAATWLPPNVAFRCTYVIRQIQVKTRYALWVVPAEHDAMARILTDCGDLQVTVAESGRPDVDGPPLTTETTPEPVANGAASGSSFKNCAEARAAGAAPLTRGQPGYSDSMDGDQDGVACEN